MSISQASTFVLTFIVAAVLVLLIKRNKNTEQDVVVYFIGFKAFEESGNDEQHSVSGRLDVVQVLQRAEGGGNLTVVNVLTLNIMHGMLFE